MGTSGSVDSKSDRPRDSTTRSLSVDVRPGIGPKEPPKKKPKLKMIANRQMVVNGFCGAKCDEICGFLVMQGCKGVGL